MLGLYQQILLREGVAADNSSEQMELRLSGLVVRQEGTLVVYNRIYREVFNPTWVEKELGNLRPYAEAIIAWESSNCQDESRLLRGQALRDAREWAAGKNLSDRDYRFLAASQELEMRAAQKLLEAERKALEAEQVKKALEAEQQANQVLAEAKRRAIQRLRWGMAALGASLVLTAALVVWADKSLKRSQDVMKKATRLERAGIMNLRRFETGAGETESLLAAVESGRSLKTLVTGNPPLPYYPAIAPLLTLQKILDKKPQQNPIDANQGELYDVSFNPICQPLTSEKDCQPVLATVGADGTARLWNLQGKLLRQINSPQGKIYSISFSPYGQILATAGADGTARLWNLQGKPLAVLKHQGAVYSVSFRSDSAFTATAGAGGTAQIWQRFDKSIALKGYHGDVYDIRFSPDGSQIATAAADGTLRIWEPSGKAIAKITAHPGKVNRLSFSRNSRTVGTVGADGTVKLWDNPNGKRRTEWIAHQGEIYSINFSPDDTNQIITAGADGAARLWDSEGNLLAEYPHDRVRSASFSPDGQHVATVGFDGKLRLWRIERLDELLERACRRLKDDSLTHPDTAKLCPPPR